MLLKGGIPDTDTEYVRRDSSSPVLDITNSAESVSF